MEQTEQTISRETLLEKYAKGKEATVEEVRRRVARALAQVEPEEQRSHWERRFLQAQEQGFIPAGRINSAAGVQLQATLINCFVQPVGDSISEVVDGKPGIYTALKEAAETMRRGGGVGYDFSSIRPDATPSVEARQEQRVLQDRPVRRGQEVRGDGDLPKLHHVCTEGGQRTAE